MSRRRLTVAGAAGILAALAALSGCGPTQLGAAAIVEDDRITVSEVQGALKAVRDLQQRYDLPVDGAATAARNEVRRRIVAMVFEQAAADLGLSVSAGEIAELYSEERSQFDDETAYLRALAERNLTPGALDREYRQALLAQKIGEQLERRSGGQMSDEELQTELGKRLVDTAGAMEIRVNPRYGRFDPNEGLIKPVRFDYFRSASATPGG